MDIRNSVALVTGANRGIGLAFTQALLKRGAKKVYAAVRDPSRVNLANVYPIPLDVTHVDQVNQAAAQALDATLIINNAGIAQPGGFLLEDSVEVSRRIFETNFYGVLHMCKAFAPILKQNGGGAIINVLSVASWVNDGNLAAYAASKSAAWSLTNSLRHELSAQGTQVLALHMGYVDTDLTRDFDIPKSSSTDIVTRALNGLEANLDEVLADDITQYVKQGLNTENPVYLPQK
ncbi:SDR family oxidoreductase [Shewanella acanthi]|uniref:SDR family oxidoreductase n=1 Tax=Shewanella acanthi TaxID=2864212 RepID=UPI001C65AE9A|nr:SDR family oxidoreductase [Shewanella acanthi]QYJ77384.1 SDR family oxidoreductase [Shewanella acanthi]